MTPRLTVLKAHRYAAALLIGTMLSAIYVLLSNPADDTFLNVLSGILAVAFIPLCLERLALQPSRQAGALWATIAILLAIVAFQEFARFVAPSVSQFDGTGALVLLVGSLVIALLLARFDPVPRVATMILCIAFAVQSLSTVLDCLDRALVARFAVDSELLTRVADFTQFIAIQVYFGAALLFLLSLNAVRLSHGQDRASVGDLSRFLFVYAGYFDRLRYPDFKRRMHLPFAWQIMFVVHFLRWYPELAPHVRRRVGRSLPGQAIDIFTLNFRHGLDAQAYYMFELYRPERCAEAAGYLTRFETKNGIIYSLNGLFERRSPVGRSWLGDKVSFTALCAELGIRCIPALARIEAGAVHWSEGCDPRLEQDFFVKRRIGKGAYGAGLYQHLPGRGHRTPSGDVLPTEVLLSGLAERSNQAKRPKRGALLIQPRLRNHPEIADLAEESLIVIRVITCQDKAGGVVATHAMLRILGMLEPRWRTKVEFGAPIGLESGRLGLLTGDKGEMATRRWEHHPMRAGVPVAGRLVPHFEAVLAEALAAHRACGDRFLVGWDIAVTPDGPLIVEGNAHLDIEFPQRVHQAPVSESPLGPILYRHLMLLDRSTALLELMRKL